MIKKKDVVILKSYVLDIISNILKRKGELSAKLYVSTMKMTVV